MGKLLVVAAYTALAAFWTRFGMHFLLWQRAARRSGESFFPKPKPRSKACAQTALDLLFFGRLLVRNPALWLGEWVFHFTFLLVLLRHLRYFLNPVPSWVWSMQTPGLIAGYILPLSLLYILAVRFLSKREKYSSPANVFLLAVVLIISTLGVLMHGWLKPNLVDVKLFVLGLAVLKPVAAPASPWFWAHFLLVLVLAVFVPTHIFSAPLVMWEARKREQALRLVMHEK